MKAVMYRGYNLAEEYADGIKTMRQYAPEGYLKSEYCKSADQMLEDKESIWSLEPEHPEEILLATTVYTERSYALQTTAAVRLVALNDEIKEIAEMMSDLPEIIEGLGTYYAKLTATARNLFYSMLGKQGISGNPKAFSHLYNVTIGFFVESENESAIILGKLTRYGLPSQIALDRATRPVPQVQAIDHINRTNDEPDVTVPAAITRYEPEFAAIWNRLVAKKYDVFYDANVA